MEQTKINILNSYLTFRLGKETFAANVGNVLQILEITEITKIPKAPPYMKGVINLRGSVLPIIDFRHKFNLPQIEHTKNTCIIVLSVEINNDTIEIGAIVDSVIQVIEVNSNEIKSAPSIGNKYKSEFISGIIEINESFIMLLNINMIFSTDDIITLPEAQEISENIETSK